tara:strand:- start:61 stop:573 length:513 start_codon:yes stop_codon:yes gene_type:complete
MIRDESYNLNMKHFCIVISFFLLALLSHSKEYVIESQGKRLIIKEHIYSNKDNFKVFRLEGTFKDNAGNFGEFNSIVSVNTIKNAIESLKASNEFIFNENVKAFNIAKRKNNELSQGVGSWYFTYASQSINAIIKSECIYSISYYKDNYLVLAKCNIPEKAFEQIKNINQ